MKRVLQWISAVALAGTIVPPVLYFTGDVGLDPAKTWMLIAGILWFVATPFWMWRGK